MYALPGREAFPLFKPLMVTKYLEYKESFSL